MKNYVFVSMSRVLFPAVSVKIHRSPCLPAAPTATVLKIQISLVGGVEFGTELVLEDSDGKRIMKESSDPGGFLGITFSFRR